ncbi:MAG: transposase [Armatimonadetes bacterium]|nr:transposase [Armatimonadota bacterium]
MAAEMFREGKSNTEIARKLGVSRKSVILWRSDWGASGHDGLKIGTPGRKSRLNDAQWRDIEKALLEGPRVHGYDTDLWTLKRIAGLIHKMTGVSYHPCSVWELLMRLGWSHQRPHRLAKERNEEEIVRWKKEEWPRIKKGHKIMEQP